MLFQNKFYLLIFVPLFIEATIIITEPEAKITDKIYKSNYIDQNKIQNKNKTLIQEVDKQNKEIVNVLYSVNISDIKEFKNKFLKKMYENKKYFRTKNINLKSEVLIEKNSIKFFLKSSKQTIYKKEIDDNELNNLKVDYARLVQAGIFALNVSKIDLELLKLKEDELLNFIKIVDNSSQFFIEKKLDNYIYVPIF